MSKKKPAVPVAEASAPVGRPPIAVDVKLLEAMAERALTQADCAAVMGISVFDPLPDHLGADARLAVAATSQDQPDSPFAGGDALVRARPEVPIVVECAEIGLGEVSQACTEFRLTVLAAQALDV